MASMSLSSVHKGSESVLDFCCTSCEEEGNTIEAEFYCEKCVKFYCDNCIIPHKQLFRTHTTYGRGNMDTWPVSKATEDYLDKCEEHVEKKMKLFCDDHNQLCCSTCVLLNHRQCSKVELIAASAKDRGTEDFNQMLSSLTAILAKLNELHKNRECNIQSLQISYQEQLKEIQDLRKKINAALKDLEDKTVTALDALMTNIKVSLTTDINNCSRLQDEIQRLSVAVQSLNDKSKNELAFIAGKKCLDKIRQSETYLKDNYIKVDSSVKFLANTDIELYLSKLSSLGSIVPVKPNQVITVKGKTGCDVRMPSDSKDACDIEGIVCLSNGQIVVADYIQKRVKLLDQQYKVISHCDVSSYPRDICQVNASEVVVTDNTHEIQFISVYNGQLAINRKLQFEHTCVGIAHHQRHLYVTSSIALYQYTLTGTLVSKLYEDTSDVDTVLKCAVSSGGDRIYVTNKCQHKLLTLASDGTVLSTFADTELQQPWGVTVTPSGQVLVCGLSSHTIIQVDFEGRKKLANVAARKDGLKSPQSVCNNSYTGSIFVGQSNNDNVLVLTVN